MRDSELVMFERLRTSDENKLVNKAFKENVRLVEYGKNSWLRNIYFYFNNFGPIPYDG